MRREHCTHTTNVREEYLCLTLSVRVDEKRGLHVHTSSVREQGVLDVCALWQEEQSENQA